MQRDVFSHRIPGRRILQLWREQDGGLTFEWIILTSLLVLSVIAATGTMLDSLVNELGDLSGAIVSINQSVTVQSTPPISGMPEQNNGFTVVDSSKDPL